MIHVISYMASPVNIYWDNERSML